MNIRIFLILLSLALGMVSSSLDDEMMTDTEQISTSDNSNPPLEETGDEDELEPND